MSTNIFSSLSGQYDFMSSMSGLLSDYSSIKSGAYGSLMKSYVNKVGNKAALNAYRETGSTTTVADSTSSSSTASATTKKSTSSQKTNFLDSHFSNIKNTGTYYKSDLVKRDAEAETTTGTNIDTTV